MRVSVVVPVYNYAGRLPQLLDSLHRQWCEGLELVLVDDGSSDDSAAVAAAWGERHPGRLRLLCQPNAGVSVARNRGVEQARGAYIWFLDADDQLAEGAVEAVIAALDSEPELLVGGYRVCDESGAQRRVPAPKVSADRKRNFRAFIERRLGLSHGAFLVRRELALAYPYPAGVSLSEDLPVFGWLLANALPTRIDAELAVIQRHAGSRRHGFDPATDVADELVALLFDPHRLPAPCLRLRRRFRAQRLASLSRSAHRAGDHRQARRFWLRALREDCRVALRWTYLSKYVRSLMAGR